MNQKNFEYLKEQIKYTGFGQGLAQQLKENMQRQPTEFSLQHQSRFGPDQLSSALHFKKSPTSDLYFFNSYLASLKNQGQSEKVNHLFFTDRPGVITLKEAFNLLQGRAVEKQFLNRQGERYLAWVQMDFKQTEPNGSFKIRQYHQNYGYDLEGSLSKLSLKELQDPASKTRLLDSLRKGNRQQVTLIDGEDQHKLFIEANPQFKAIIAYDQHAVRQQIREATQSQHSSLFQGIQPSQQASVKAGKHHQQDLSIG